jgi:hypothetical protein
MKEERHSSGGFLEETVASVAAVVKKEKTGVDASKCSWLKAETQIMNII